jgi:hypothetical protein
VAVGAAGGAASLIVGKNPILSSGDGDAENGDSEGRDGEGRNSEGRGSGMRIDPKDPGSQRQRQSHAPFDRRVPVPEAVPPAVPTEGGDSGDAAA